MIPLAAIGFFGAIFVAEIAWICTLAPLTALKAMKWRMCGIFKLRGRNLRIMRH